MSNEEKEQKVPKKRGRKPKKLQLDTEVKIPKKRGRKPKKVQQDTDVKIPKKRGRKPKSQSYGVYDIKNTTKDVESENIILHLPINTKNIIKSSKEDELLTYNPHINEPVAWDGENVVGKHIDSVAFIDIYKKAENYAHYPFDEKEKDIVDILTKDEEESTETSNNHSILENDVVHKDIQSNINITHDTNWYSESVSMEKNVAELDDVIEHMKNKRKKDIENVSSYQLENHVQPTLLQLKETNRMGKWPTSTSIYCWWCCHAFNGSPCSLPYEYKNDTFYVYGIFCSPECSAAYNFDNSTTDERWERYALLNLLYRKMYNDKNLKIKLAAPRQTLKIFGGSISINDFRLNNSNYEKTFKIIPQNMISIVPQQEYNFIEKGYTSTLNKKQIQVDKNSVNSNELVLKRSKPFRSTKNPLEKCMNLSFS